MTKPNVFIAVNHHWFTSIFPNLNMARLSSMANVTGLDAPAQITKDYLLEHLPDSDIAITSWDSPCFDQAVMTSAPKLKLLCHAAGSVRPVVSDALWRTGVQVTSYASAISYGVAEFCLGLILMGTKRVFWLSAGTKQRQWMEQSSSFGGILDPREKHCLSPVSAKLSAASVMSSCAPDSSRAFLASPTTSSVPPSWAIFCRWPELSM